jgi:5-carboxymethyl-2-hydroxymuconate isomerase
MPHFTIDCSEDVLEQTPAEDIMRAVYEEAEASGLFAQNDIKVRMRPYRLYQLGAGKTDFLHVYGDIMEGRTVEQRAALSRRIIGRLHELLPGLSILSMNVREFERATYCNRALIHPDNTQQNRHFEPVPARDV